jgi:hypothetical protein
MVFVNSMSDLFQCWYWLDAIEHGEDQELALRKSAAPAASAGLDLSEVSAAVEAGSFESVSDAVARSRAERLQREEEQRGEFEENLERARREQAEQIEHARLQQERLTEA